MGYLPKKLESHKKMAILGINGKIPDSIHKIKDYEYDRLEYT